jgi:hypothetical protein
MAGAGHPQQQLTKQQMAAEDTQQHLALSCKGQVTSAAATSCSSSQFYRAPRPLVGTVWATPQQQQQQQQQQVAAAG